jgi:hypothetical protein
MTGNNANKQLHPAYRVLTWGVPLVALAVIAFIMVSGREDKRSGEEITPPAQAAIPYVGFAEIDSIISGASKAFEKGEYEESASLLARARFFIQSGIREERFDRLPRNLELILGLSEFYRGYPRKGIISVTSAVESEPQNETYRWYLGLMHLYEGNREDARKHLERTVAIGGIYSESAKMILDDM